MLRAAICDDESVILSMMKSSIEKTFLQEKFDCSIQAFSSGEELLKILEDYNPLITKMSVLRDGLDEDLMQEIKYMIYKTLTKNRKKL